MFPSFANRRGEIASIEGVARKSLASRSSLASKDNARYSANPGLT